ncbi:MAG TPA: ion channel [Kofleriaceae bacterium]|jgi:inward rectifier potassium channel|nr:ion channel [Kofleriaceae bacterium]
MPPLALRDLPKTARKVTQQGSTFYVIGDSRALFLRDAYHLYLRLPWSAALGAFAAAFFAINLGFAVAYYAAGGIGGSDGSFFDALSFSVQTFGTIGYGKLYPDGTLTQWIMVVESIISIIVTALATGLMFSKFARPTTRIAFSRSAVITQHEGNRTLIFRLGNRRSNIIVEATIHVVAVLTTVTAEGKTFYKAVDLPMVRDRQVGMTRGWTVMHVITPSSPLYQVDADKLRQLEFELYVALTGLDNVSMQTVHAIHQYTDDQIRIDHHLEDTLMPLDNGGFVIDLTRFDSVVPDDAPDRTTDGTTDGTTEA